MKNILKKMSLFAVMAIAVFSFSACKSNASGGTEDPGTTPPPSYVTAPMVAFKGLMDWTATGANVNITNNYTASTDITVTRTGEYAYSLSGEVQKGTPWFWTTQTGNWLTVGFKLPEGFTGTHLYESGVYINQPRSVVPHKDSTGNVITNGWSSTKYNSGSTALATSGAALGYFDFSIDANEPAYVENKIFKVRFKFTETSEFVTYTLDLSGLNLLAA